MSLFDSASLVITPNGYKEDKLYSVIPTDGSGDLSVTRATTATRVNSSGVIANVSTNVPRLDYTGSTCPSILVEPQRTNVILYSEQFNNASWDQTNIQVTANNVISPDGTQNADTLTNIGSGTQIGTIASVTPSQSYVFSVYLKRLTGSGVVSLIDTNGNATNITLTNQWQRFSVVSTPVLLGRAYIRVMTTGDSVAVWGAQLEAGSYPTSYIPTVASTVTRNADVISKTGISSLIGQTEGTLFCEINTQQSAANNWFQVLDGTANNWIFIGLNGDKLVCYIRVGASTYIFDQSFVLTNGVSYKLALAYKSGDSAFYINGNEIATTGATFTFSNSLSQLIIGDLTSPPNDAVKYKQAALWETRLSNTELASLTTI